MSSVNKVILIGNLGADPEVRRTQDGRPVVWFTMATGESWRDKATGERKQHTDWHRVVIFNEGLCKVAEDYIKKGSKVYIEGANKTRKWTDKDGVERYVTEVVLGPFNSRLVMLDKAERAPGADSLGDYGSGDTRDQTPPTDGTPPADNDQPPQQRKPAMSGGKRDDMDDEIPF